jgi:hypothetical protein
MWASLFASASERFEAAAQVHASIKSRFLTLEKNKAS